MRESVILVLSAPTGGGKTTIGRRVVAEDGRVRFSVSHTTRSPRPGETDDLDYHFVDRPRFEAMAAAGEFLEWAEVHGHLYGTHMREVARAGAEGLDLLMDIDVQGGLQVKRARPAAVLVFILPPSLEVLLDRLAGRTGERGFDLGRRLRSAEKELEFSGVYEYNVVNEDLDRAVGQVRCILDAARLRPLQGEDHVGGLRRHIAGWLREKHVQG